MYRTGPQLVQSVGVGVLAEQQHSIGHQLPYKQRGLHWLQLKPFTQSTVAHLGRFSWVQWTVGFHARGPREHPCIPEVATFPAHLLVPDPAGWSHGFGAREPLCDVELEDPLISRTEGLQD